MHAHGPWSPLAVRAFRALWIASLVSNLGTFMHAAAAGWTMTTLTDSAALVGLVQTAWGSPGFLLALPAGALADLVDRRRLIAASSAVALGVAAVLAALTGSGRLGPTVLLVGTFVLSSALTCGAPAFLALTPTLVDAARLPQAIGLDAVSRNVAQSVGPAIAGAVIAASGPGAVFAVNATTFLGIIVVALRLPPAAAGVGGRGAPFVRAMGDGVRHVVRERELRHLALRIATLLASTSSVVALLPLVARERIGLEAGGFGLLAGALGFGAVAIVPALPRLRRRVPLERLALLAAAAWCTSVVALASATALAAAAAAVAVGAAATMASLNGQFSAFIVQLPDALRGRGSSLAMLVVWLGASVGASIWGAAAGAAGVRGALLAAAATHGVAALTARVALPVGRAGN